MGYFMYTRLVAISKAKGMKRPHEEVSATDNVSTGYDSAPGIGRETAQSRYDFFGDYRAGYTQYLRRQPKVVDIMCEPPLEEANPENFGRLLMVLLKPFFEARDLYPQECKSWHEAYRNYPLTRGTPVLSL